jgi:hypothetical protein
MRRHVEVIILQPTKSQFGQKSSFIAANDSRFCALSANMNAS